MDEYKILFVGVGSIAMRHIHNLNSIGKQHKIGFTIDALRRSDSNVAGVRNVYQKIKDVPNDYDAVFITNPTELHLSTLEQVHDHGQNFFIEKPVVSTGQIERAKKCHTKKNSVYYVACPLRYSAVIQYLKNNLNPDDVLSVRSISSSYLPNWRPGQDYRETYSAKKELGGGVSIDLIHEWDYLTYLFGWPQRVKSMIGKKSPLEINSDDYAVYIAEYADKIVELHLDYFGKHTLREIQLITKEETIVGDLVNNKIVYLNQCREISFHEVRNDYQKRELLHFFSMIRGEVKHEDGFANGIRLLELSQGGVMV